jgi:hypothetical protein
MVSGLVTSSSGREGGAMMNAFIQEAVKSGFRHRIALAAMERVSPWVRRRPLSLDTRLYEDLGIVDEDLEEVLYGL